MPCWLASRDASISALQGAKANATLLASYATASETQEGPGYQGGPQRRPVERPLQAGRVGLQRAPTREDVEKQAATEFRGLQDNADRFQHNKDLTNRRMKAIEDAGAFRAPTNAASNVQQLRAVDSMTVRSTEGRETLLKLALPAPQGSGNAAARRGCGEAAGRLPGAQAAQKRFGPLTFLSRLDGSNMP